MYATIMNGVSAVSASLIGPPAEAPQTSAQSTKSADPNTSSSTPNKRDVHVFDLSQIVSPNRAAAVEALTDLFVSNPMPKKKSPAKAKKSPKKNASIKKKGKAAAAPKQQQIEQQTKQSTSKEKQPTTHATGRYPQGPPHHHPPVAYYYAYPPPYGPPPSATASSKKSARGKGSKQQQGAVPYMMPPGYRVTPSPPQGKAQEYNGYLPHPHMYAYPYGHTPGAPSPASNAVAPATRNKGTSATSATNAKKGKKTTRSLPAAAVTAGVSASAPRPVKKQKVAASAKKDREYDRTEKSLAKLTVKFMRVYADKTTAPLFGDAAPEESTLSVDEAAARLEVERRRIYDIINILESLHIVSRAKKNTYVWHGAKNLQVVFARLQQECFVKDEAEARKTGVLKADTYRSVDVTSGDEEDSERRTEKSLGKVSREFLRVFLWGHVSIDLAELSDRILGTQSSACESEDNEEAAKAAKKMKTKIRRLYDVANVFQALGIVEKINSGGSYTQGDARPSFNWTYRVSPADLPNILRNYENNNGLHSPATHEASITDSAKKMLAHINQIGAVDDSIDENAANTLSSLASSVSRSSSTSTSSSDVLDSAGL